MHRSTDATDVPGVFAADVLEELLRYITENNESGRYTFLVSHAWTEGPMMYLVYQAPPSATTWGLARDTSRSLIDPGPWASRDEAVRYYYILDLEGIQPTECGRQGEPETILWLGDPHVDLPGRPSDVPEQHRLTPASPATRPSVRGQRVVNEPRRYVDPREL